MNNDGKLVTISYVGRLDSGWVFISTPPESPITFPCSDGWMPPEFIETVRSMEIGETRVAHVGADVAYEERTDDRIVRVPRASLAQDTALKPGDLVHLQSSAGTEHPARLISIDADEAVFDMNHDAVGQGMHFEITLLDVKDLPR